MKNLWCFIPPPLADNFGLIEIVKNSDGCAVIDDCSPYWTGNYENSRIAVSNIDNKDIISGTRAKILYAFEELKNSFNPKFALFSSAPCGAMIGTDLSEIADCVNEKFHIPAAALNLTGQTTYDVGLSKTIETLICLFAKAENVIERTVNILGANKLDWEDDDIKNFNEWIIRQGYSVILNTGVSITSENLANVAKAQLNLAVNVSGLATARYLKSHFGTPFIAAAPFGEENVQLISSALHDNEQFFKTIPLEKSDTLIIAEQFTANAIRNTLEKKYNRITDIATFYKPDKEYARKKDKYIRDESSAKILMSDEKYKLIIADPLLKPLAKKSCRWIVFHIV